MTVISISSVSRSELPSARDAAFLEGFCRGLELLAILKRCSMRETLVALENWYESGVISSAQTDALLDYHGWRRGE